MVDKPEENDELGNEPETPEWGIVQEFPKRKVDLNDVEVDKSEIEDEEGVNKSNIQTAVDALIPKFRNKRLNEILRPIMSGRVMPDNFIDLNYLLTMMMIEEKEGVVNEKGFEDVDFLAIITGNQVGTEVGYEGRNRAEILELIIGAQEAEIEKLSKDLGF